MVHHSELRVHLERPLNLSALAVGLGLEVTEYEPEKFPGLVYRPRDHECVLLVFATGRVIITGAQGISEADTVLSTPRSNENTT